MFQKRASLWQQSNKLVVFRSMKLTDALHAEYLGEHWQLMPVRMLDTSPEGPSLHGQVCPPNSQKSRSPQLAIISNFAACVFYRTQTTSRRQLLLRRCRKLPVCYPHHSGHSRNKLKPSEAAVFSSANRRAAYRQYSTKAAWQDPTTFMPFVRLGD